MNKLAGGRWLLHLASAIVLLVLGLGWVRSAQANTLTASTPPWHIAVAVGTDFPIGVGGRVDMEGPWRLRASVSLGALPGPYVSAINGFLVGVNAFGDSTAELIKQTLSSSLVLRTHLGWRPFARRGFYVDGGYALVTLGGSASSAELIAGVTGRPAPERDGRHQYTLSATSTLHMLDLEFGWCWPLWRRLQLRTAVGGAFTVRASTRITPDYTPKTPQLTAAFTEYGESYLDDIFTSYVFTPVVSLSLGYAFF